MSCGLREFERDAAILGATTTSTLSEVAGEGNEPASGVAAPTYPMTPVDCLISELRDIIAWSEPSNLLADFEARVRQFKGEVAAARVSEGATLATKEETT